MFEARQHKSTEQATLLVRFFERFFGQEPGKKFLRQILCVLRAASLPPDKTIKGVPIDPGQVFKRFARNCPWRLSRCEHDTPVSTGELRSFWESTLDSGLGMSHALRITCFVLIIVSLAIAKASQE